MQFILIILAAVCFLSGIFSLCYCGDKWGTTKAELAMYAGAMLLVATGFIANFVIGYNEPKAIDVYRGKTKISVTYEDTVPVDTVVVFKKEYKPW